MEPIKMPEFDKEKHGYNKQQVDAYIGYLRGEYDRAAGQARSAVPDGPGFYVEQAIRDFRDQQENGSPSADSPEGQGLPAGKAKRKSRITGAVFYLALIILVVTVYVFSSAQTGAPRELFGYSAMTVLTGSMQREIPKDSLVVTKHIDPNTIKLGDDLTYLLTPKITVTHQVVGIYEDYNNTGARGFKMKGLENPLPDAGIVPAQDVVGKVIFHNHIIGAVITLIKQNAIIVIIMTILIIGWIAAMRVFFHSSPKAGKRKRRGGGEAPQASPG